MSTPPIPKLFQPIKVGTVELAHRVVLAPLTRFRADDAHVHSDLAAEHYAQRGSTPGTLLISEATFISPQAGGYPRVPGIWNDAQTAAWKRVTDAVHAQGSYIYLQLWALGRAANAGQLASEDPSFTLVSASDLPLPGYAKPRPLSIPEIEDYVQVYAAAAKNAMHGAGFDGVEVHCANGYLLDQFLQDVSNTRTDAYGGSVENRCRFPLAAIDAVVEAVGAEHTGVRVSPWSGFQEMRMDNPVPTFSYFASQLVARHPDMAYIHAVEPRAQGGEDREVQAGESNEFLRAIWAPRPFISAGGYDRARALATVEEKGGLVAFGRLFIANPDLPVRLRKDIPLAKTDRSKYYTAGAEGYVDYPFAEAGVSAL
ncbi:NADH:flavin oxidoreductase/NADH oxidase [Amylocystis lapponica]|nr:NADH:flavin oxidoreductase/NADH oxidase [Amylocystis lapponica]